MQIPSKFTIFGQTINVITKEIDLDDNRYGYWNDVTNEIVIFRSVRVDGETLVLSREQLAHTFWHEYRHAVQSFTLGKCDEQDAQSFASAMIELIKSSNLKINPNEIISDKPKVYDSD